MVHYYKNQKPSMYGRVKNKEFIIIIMNGNLVV